jgi:hypothetical protein
VHSTTRRPLKNSNNEVDMIFEVCKENNIATNFNQ